MPEDPIDHLIQQWRRERPDLDPAPMALVGRLFRVARAADRSVDEQFAAHGLEPGWFDVLSALRRSGAPYRLSPGRLSGAVMLSSGGMTKRLDRMEADGLLERWPDPQDRRGVLVGLTRRGRRVVDKAVAAHIDNEVRLLAGLTPAERGQLDRLLRKLDSTIASSSR